MAILIQYSEHDVHVSQTVTSKVLWKLLNETLGELRNKTTGAKP
jgi:hypothetical protein